MSDTVLDTRQKQSAWILLPFFAYSAYRISGSLNRLFPIWSDWRDAGGVALTANQEYLMWTALGGISFSLLLPIPLIMQRVGKRAMWALGVLWLVLFAGELFVDRNQDAAFTRKLAEPGCSEYACTSPES